VVWPDEYGRLVMQVEIVVKVGGQVVKKHVQEVDGTLERMEEDAHALGKRVSNSVLQASVDAKSGPRPLFRKRAVSGSTRATRAARSLGSMG
jgi:hypothetical protein